MFSITSNTPNMKDQIFLVNLYFGWAICSRLVIISKFLTKKLIYIVADGSTRGHGGPVPPQLAASNVFGAHLN